MGCTTVFMQETPTAPPGRVPSCTLTRDPQKGSPRASLSGTAVPAPSASSNPPLGATPHSHLGRLLVPPEPGVLVLIGSVRTQAAPCPLWLQPRMAASAPAQPGSVYSRNLREGTVGLSEPWALPPEIRQHCSHHKHGRGEAAGVGNACDPDKDADMMFCIDGTRLPFGNLTSCVLYHDCHLLLPCSPQRTFLWRNPFPPHPQPSMAPSPSPQHFQKGSYFLLTSYLCTGLPCEKGGDTSHSPGIGLVLATGQSVSSVAQLCLTLCDPMDHSSPGLPVHHQLPEFTQIHFHQVGDATHPSHPLSFPSPSNFNLSQHQDLFK